MKQTFHYGYFVYTDNLCYGRMFLGKFRSLCLAQNVAEHSGRGVCRIMRQRVYEWRAE